MTVSTRPYYHWNSRNDSEVPPFNACSPNLLQILAFCQQSWRGVSLGCHVQRVISGSGSLSSHAWGAALDVRFPNRQVTESAMSGLIAFSHETHVNTIHDYALQRKWDPNIGWHPASIGSIGGDWIHVETTPEGFGDSTPIADRLPGGQLDVPLDANDKAFITTETNQVAGETWRSPFGAAEGEQIDRPAKDWLLDIYGKARATGDQVAVITGQIAKVEEIMTAILKAIEGGDIPVTGTIHIDTGLPPG